MRSESKRAARMMLRAGLLAMTLVGGAGCSDGPLSPAERRELAVARNHWARKGSADYTVECRICCFCLPHLNFWTRLTVRGGKVTAAEPVETLPNGITPSLLGWHTVDELFSILESLSSDVLEDLMAQYDPTLGYPREISVTCHPNIQDCGSVYGMRNLQIQ